MEVTFISHPRMKDCFVPEDCIGGRRKYLIMVKHHALSLYFMKAVGYILVNYLIDGTTTSLVVSLDGGNKVGTSDMLSSKKNALGLEQASFTAIPSRDGSIIAGIASMESGLVYHLANFERMKSMDMTLTFRLSLWMPTP
jgi:hypothetical protein